MDISIIIPTIRADQQLFDQCVEAVYETAPDAEVIVAEGGTFAENCNQGATRAAGDIYIFLNDDTIPHVGWSYALCEPLTEGAAIAGARLLYPDGRLQHTGIYFTLEQGLLTAVNRTWDVPTQQVDAVTGACMAVRADAFHELGGFDTGFRNGYEDVDICLRAREAGLVIYYVAEANVTHYESRSGPARWEWVGDNIERLQHKWVVEDAQ